MIAAFLWEHCLEYEHQIRKEAIRLCREEDWSIEVALRFTHKNQEQWMKDWVETLSLANQRSRSAGPASSPLKKKMAESYREVAELKRSLQALTGRARSPPREDDQKQTGQRQRQRQRTFSKYGLGKGNSKGKTQKAPRQEMTETVFKDLIQGQRCLRLVQKRFVCDQRCDRLHSCTGCNKLNVPYSTSLNKGGPRVSRRSYVNHVVHLCRILLQLAGPHFCSNVLASSNTQQTLQCAWRCEVLIHTFVEVCTAQDALVLFDLLDHVQAGAFHMIFLGPFAST